MRSAESTSVQRIATVAVALVFLGLLFVMLRPQAEEAAAGPVLGGPTATPCPTEKVPVGTFGFCGTPTATPDHCLGCEMELRAFGPPFSKLRCDSRNGTLQSPAKCTFTKGSTFTVEIFAKTIPPGGYTAFGTALFYGDILYKPTALAEDEIVWTATNSDLELRAPHSSVINGTERLVLHGGLNGLVNPVLHFGVEPLVRLEMNCQTQSPSASHAHKLVLLARADPLPLKVNETGTPMPISPFSFLGPEGATYVDGTLGIFDQNIRLPVLGTINLDLDGDTDIDRFVISKNTPTPINPPPLAIKTLELPNQGPNLIDYPVAAVLDINCEPATPVPTTTSRPHPGTPTPLAPVVVKSPALSNIFLTAQGTKVPPPTCLEGTDGAVLTQSMNRGVPYTDKHGDQRDLGGFSFQVNYDETKVCVTIVPGPLASAWVAGGGSCIIFDSVTKPSLQGSATIACNQLGKDDVSVGLGGDTRTLANVIVRPMPDEYSIMKSNNGNGNVVQIINKACKLTDQQGDPIAPQPGEATCTDADITVRYLEGDVVPDCVIDTLDTQAVAFRWGSNKGTLLYNDFFNTEPSKPQGDDDIDINDLQFVYGRFNSTCFAQWPPQPPVNAKTG